MSSSPNTPPVRPTPVAAVPAEGDATGGVIPYKNPKALIAYYVSIASLLVPLAGIVAVVLGVQGLRARERNPVIKGSVHAWIGIVLGGLTALLQVGCLGLVLFGVFASRMAATGPVTPVQSSQGAPAEDDPEQSGDD